MTPSKCCLCGRNADRVFAGRLPMCLQDYSDARVGRLDDDKAKKLNDLWNAQAEPEPAKPARRGLAEAEAPSPGEAEPVGEVAAGEGGD